MEKMTSKLFTRTEIYSIFEKPYKLSVTSPFILHGSMQWYVEYLGQEYELCLENVEKTTLREVAKNHYDEEGFESEEKFLDNWKEKLGWVNDQPPTIDPDQIVWRAKSFQHWKHFR